MYILFEIKKNVSQSIPNTYFELFSTSIVNFQLYDYTIFLHYYIFGHYLQSNLSIVLKKDLIL